jgi:nicotinamidase-related amidase
MEQNTKNTALLVMDMQAGILGMLPDASLIIANTARAITNARDKKIPVIYVTLSFRQGAPEISMNNKRFAEYHETFATVNMADFAKIHPDLAPQSGDVTVTKRRVSAFTGSDLEVVLRAFEVKHMVLTGVSTSGVVLSALCEAADKDYRLTVLADCCADGDEEVHRVLTTKVFPRHAEALTVEDWCKL